MNALSIWFLAARPRTLALSITPVLVGSALAFAATGSFNAPAGVAALIAAMLIQIGTNLHNDAADSLRGADGPDRVGPLRVTAQGLLPAATVTRAAMGCFALAFVIGLYLLTVGGWQLFAFGVLSLGMGWAYTGGPYPIAYTPLGEIVVLIFFGLGAVGGTYWLHTGMLDSVALTGGVTIGLFASAVLLVNNHRDREADKAAGRRTMAMCLGIDGTKRLFMLLLTVPFALLPVLAALLPHHAVWLAWLAAPVALNVTRQFLTEPPGPGLNAVLAKTARLQALFGLALGIGLIL